MDKMHVAPAFVDLMFGLVGRWEIRQQDFGNEDSRS